MSETARKVSSAAAKILSSSMATKAEKAVAIAAITQTKTSRERGSSMSSAAKASKEAKSVAASALTQKPRKNMATLHHEALDRAYTITVMIEELLVGHPGLSTPELRLKLKAVEDAAHDLYQAIGATAK